MTRTTTAIRFPAELHERLVVAADDRDVSLNFLVNKAVAYYLDRLIPAEEIRWTRDDSATQSPTNATEPPAEVSLSEQIPDGHRGGAS